MLGLGAGLDRGRWADHAQDLAKLAFNSAGLTIGRLADALARDPEASCPENQFLSTWKYILKKGGLFQTTLTLAWLDGDRFRIAMVGDGAALWRGYGGPRGPQANDRVLAACNLDSHQVYALGPADRCLQDFDCSREELARRPVPLRAVDRRHRAGTRRQAADSLG